MIYKSFSIVFYQNPAWFIILYIITKSMRALWLVYQLWVIVPVNPRKNRASSELLYKSNRPQVSMVYLINRPQVSMGYKLINHAGCWSNTRRICLWILTVFYQHPNSLSAYNPKKLVVYCFYIIIQKKCNFSVGFNNPQLIDQSEHALIWLLYKCTSI